MERTNFNFGSMRPGALNCNLSEGNVRSIPVMIDLTVYADLATHNDGNPATRQD